MKKKYFGLFFALFALVSFLFPTRIFGEEVASPTFTVPWSNYDLTKSETKNWEIPVTSTKISPKADVVFVFDTTGSMGVAKTWASSTLATFAINLQNAGATDINWGAYSFGDSYADTPSYLNYGLELGKYTNEEVSAGLTSLEHYGGGDIPEDSIYATMEAISDTNWREGSQKFIILVTDAGSKERPDIFVGDHNVTADGLKSLAAEKGIDISVHDINGKSYDVSNSETGISAISLESLCNSLGVTRNISSNSDQLLSKLSVSLSEDYIKSWKYSYSISSVYEDGTPSSDIDVSITPENFILSGDASGSFEIKAVASDSPQVNKTTTVTITFYCNGELVNNGVNATQTLTLTEKKELIQYPVEFISNGGSSVPTQTVDENEKAVKPTNPTKDGCVFEGWYIDKELTTLYNFDTPVTKPTKLYAKWQEKQITKKEADKTSTSKTIISTKTERKLPKTGNNNQLSAIVLGFSFVGLVLYIFNKKRKIY